ncbi:MAG: AMP-binding protein [Firmicutes bacterium]|nr:AMP-binding protein [Bacillota bacterium]
MAENIAEMRKEAMEWANGIIEAIDNDSRPYVQYKESRPIYSLKNMVQTTVEMYPDNIAYKEKFNPKGEFEEITYAQTYEDVNGLGTWMMSKGLGGKRVAVIGANGYRWCSSYLAVVCGIGCVVPLDKELNAAELKQQIIRSEVSCVVFAKKHLKVFKEIFDAGDTELEILINMDSEEEIDGVYSWKKCVEEGKQLIADGNNEFLEAELDVDAMGVLLFTSGTTGVPKGVMLSQKNICADIMIMPTLLHLGPEDTYMSFLPLHHTFECTCCFLEGFYKGATVAFCQGLKYITKNMQELRPTILLGVPALFDKLYKTIMKNVKSQGKEKKLATGIKINSFTKKIGIDLSDKLFKDIHDVFGGRMKTLICGGAKVDPDVMKGLENFGFISVQGYGLTEAAPVGALNPHHFANPSALGVPLPCQEHKIINPDEDGIGELCIKGPNIMMGYYDDPEETAKVIDDEGWFHTGDVGYIDENGYAILTGRAKNVIITKNGKNVYPEEIEYYIDMNEFVEESMVYEDSNTAGDDTIIVAAIKCNDEEVAAILGENYTDEDVKKLVWDAVDKINDEAPAYRKIKRVIVRKTNFVRNSTAKIIRSHADNKTE